MRHSKLGRLGVVGLCLLLAMALTGVAVADDASPLTTGTGDVNQPDAVQPGDSDEGEPVVIPNRSSLEAGAYYIQSAYLNTHVLGFKGSSVRLFKTTGTTDQRWRLVVGDDGYATIKNAKSGKVLSVKGGKADEGAVVVQATKKKEKAAKASSATGSTNGSDANKVGAAATNAATTEFSNLHQKWVVKKRGANLVITSALDKKLVIGIDGDDTAKVHKTVLAKRTNEKRQLFRFVPTAPTAAEMGAKTVEDGVYLLSVDSKAKKVLALTKPYKTEGKPIAIADFAANTKQAFKLKYDKKGFYTITNAFTGKMLAPIASCSVPRIGVSQYAFKKASDRAKWRIDETKYGYRFVNKATGLALDRVDSKPAVGTVLEAAAVKDNKKAQSFKLVRPCELSPAKSKVKGVKYVAMAIDKSCVIGSRDDSRLNSVSTVIRHRGNTNLQRFSLVSAGDGAYHIQNVTTKRMVSLSNPSEKSGVNVVMRWPDGSDMQRWKVVYNDDFTFAFQSVLSGMHLNVAGAGTEDNTNVTVKEPDTGSDAQKFKLYKTKKNTKEPVILNVPCYMQNPQLPTGCESVALTNAIRYWGIKLGKTTIANSYMPYGSDGVYNFIGNPRDYSGWIICAPGICNTANSFFKARGYKRMGAEVLKGKSMSYLRECLYRGEPVVVWTTIGMGSPGTVQWWNRGYPMRSNNHAVVIAGYDPKSGDYYIADSLAGHVWRNGRAFESLYRQMGSQAVHLFRG